MDPGSSPSRWTLACLASLSVATGCGGSATTPAPKSDAGADEAKSADAATPSKTDEPDEPEPAPSDGPKQDDGKAADPDADAPKPDAPAGPHALVLADGELRRLAADGSTTVAIAVPKAIDCDVDEHHGAVWFVTDEELLAWDHDDGKLHRVAKHSGTFDDFAWQVVFTEGHFPTQVAGNADDLEHCSALSLSVETKPKIGGVKVSIGDRDMFCLDPEVIEGDDPDLETLTPEAEAVRKQYDTARLTDAAYVTELADRRQTSRTDLRWPAAKEPSPAPKPKIDPSNCMVDEDCGETRYVGGKRLWWIVTATSRGDFYHEDRQLYDTKTNEFWDVMKDRRSAEPFAEGEEFLQVHASPDDTWGLAENHILSLTEAKRTGAFKGELCGWDWPPTAE